MKYRGVLIGSVAKIEIAPDLKHVDATLALDVAQARTLGLAQVTPELRAQLGTQGITGVKFVDIDFFDPKTNPPPPLPFPPAENYIPPRPSLMKGLEENLEVVGERLPDLIDATLATLERIEAILGDFQGQRIPDRMAKAVDEIDGAASDMRRLVRRTDGAQIPDKIAGAIDGLSAAVAKVNGLLEGSEETAASSRARSVRPSPSATWAAPRTARRRSSNGRCAISTRRRSRSAGWPRPSTETPTCSSRDARRRRSHEGRRVRRAAAGARAAARSRPRRRRSSSATSRRSGSTPRLRSARSYRRSGASASAA